MYIPLDMLEAVVISAVGGVAVEVGSSNVGGVAEGVAVEGGSLAVGGVAVEGGSLAVGGVAGGVAVEVGSSAVVSVTVSWQLAFPPRGVSWLGPG